MILTDFPDEILVQIFSDSILNTADLHSLSLCSRRLSYLVIPCIYRNIDILDDENLASDIETRLSLFSLTLATHPQRGTSIQAATFTKKSTSDVDLPRPIQAKMYEWLNHDQQFCSDNDLEKIRKTWHPSPSACWYGYSSYEEEVDNEDGGSDAETTYSSDSVQSLRCSPIDSFLTTTPDIDGLLTLSSLTKLTVIGFVTRLSESSISSKSNIEVLEFRQAKFHPTGLDMENFLKTQTKLRRLTIETFASQTSPKDLSWCLFPLRNTLVELELTIVMRESDRDRRYHSHDVNVLDLSKFKALKRVELWDDLLLSGDEYKGVTQYFRPTLAQRLPASLSSLTVSCSLFLLGINVDC